jgi:hypothetical protein
MHSLLSLQNSSLPHLIATTATKRKEKKKEKKKKNGSVRRRPRRNKSILFSVVRSPSVAFSRHFFQISPPCSD